LARLLEAKLLTEKLKSDLKAEVLKLKARVTGDLVLASVEVGSDQNSGIYTNMQKKAAQNLGIEYLLHTLPNDTSEGRLLDFIGKLNSDPKVSGIIVQMPLPAHIAEKRVGEFISPEKDIEGIHPYNLGRLLLGETKIIPCTAASVMELIRASGVELYGKNACIVGRSEIVGKPLIFLLLEASCTVTVCHSGTSKAGKLADFVGNADILVVALGKPEFIKGSWVKNGAVVIDVGINKVDDQIVGDVEFKGAFERAAYISPVPGGVGPLTVLMLMRNFIEAAKLQNKI
jgi:methylenetetrahydrofolate dehydrogenase (NADP+)/methenyltetrahydrofolate cyclohydrolase